MEALEFLKALGLAKYSIPELFDMCRLFISTVMADGYILTVTGFIWDNLSAFLVYVPIGIIAISLLVNLLGKRIFPVLRFVSFFAAGFFLGIYFLSPLIIPSLNGMPVWVIGIVVGTLVAVLSKYLYFGVLAVGAAYSVYILTARIFIDFNISVPISGVILISALVAVALTVLVFLFRSYVEMAATALLGGLGICLAVKIWWDYTALPIFTGIEFLPTLIVTLLFGVLGFIVQYKTRERYD